MPTGYTAKLCEGEQDVAEFVKQAARGMGAFMHQRDDGFDVDPELPDPEANRYYRKGLDEAYADRAVWVESDEEERFEKFLKVVADRTAENQKSIRDAAVVCKRLDDMIYSINSLTFPEELNGFRDFMLQQLEETKRFDGKAYTSHVPENFETWVQEQDEMHDRMVQRYEELLVEEDERIEERKKYAKLYREFFDQLGVTL